MLIVLFTYCLQEPTVDEFNNLLSLQGSNFKVEMVLGLLGLAQCQGYNHWQTKCKVVRLADEMGCCLQQDCTASTFLLMHHLMHVSDGHNWTFISRLLLPSAIVADILVQKCSHHTCLGATIISVYFSCRLCPETNCAHRPSCGRQYCVPTALRSRFCLVLDGCRVRGVSGGKRKRVTSGEC